MDTSMNDRVSNALAATKAFVAVLKMEALPLWATRFESIAQSLEQGAIAEAIRQFEASSYTGPGSLSDVFAKNDAEFYAAWGACSKALRGLKHLPSQSRRS